MNQPVRAGNSRGALARDDRRSVKSAHQRAGKCRLETRLDGAVARPLQRVVEARSGCQRLPVPEQWRASHLAQHHFLRPHPVAATP